MQTNDHTININIKEMKNLIVKIVILYFLLSSCKRGKSWEEVKLENKVETYKEFLENNKETEHKDSILLLIRELDWI